MRDYYLKGRIDLIEFKNVTYVYKNKGQADRVAVNKVSFCINDGEFVGIIGHTGSGKSTLTELMSGLIKATEGSVIVDGVDIKNAKSAVKALKGKVGMVFQYPEHQLFEESVIKDICFGPKNLGFDEEECVKRAREAMALVRLGEEYENLSPFELSGGEKRRVAIAGILAMQPDVLILDEPVAGLDPVGRDALIDTLMAIKGKMCKSIVMVSHSMEDVARSCDKVIVMNDGNMVKCASVREVYSDADTLVHIGLDIPQVTRLIARLNEKGYNFDKNILTVDEAVEAIYKRVKGME